MSSTDLDAPPLKSILIAVLVVLGLHVFTAVALVAMKPSIPKTPLPKPIPPIEIELVSLPAALPKQTIEAAKSVEKNTPKVEVEKTPSLPKPQPTAATKPKPVTETPKKPVLPKQKSEVIAPAKVEKPAPVDKEHTEYKEHIVQELPIKKPMQQNKSEPNIDKAINNQQAKDQQDEQRRLVAAQAEKAAQEAAQQARAQQEDIQKASAKAARDAQAQADAKAEKEAAQKAEAAARAKEAAASNEPVNFTASSANWSSAPNLSFPERAARRARSGDTFNVVLVLRVNKQGGIDDVRIAQSSGNAALDKEAARQVRSGKFKPFMKNGVPVVGNVTLPVTYSVP